MKKIPLPHQEEAIEIIASKNKGIIHLPTASGKSLIQCIVSLNSFRDGFIWSNTTIKLNGQEGRSIPVYVILSPRILLSSQLLGDIHEQMHERGKDNQYLIVHSQGPEDNAAIKFSKNLPYRQIKSTTSSIEIRGEYLRACKEGEYELCNYLKNNNIISVIYRKIEEQSNYSKDKSDKHGEVFTPFPLINEMLDSLPQEIFSDPSKTFFDPTSGFGNMPAVIIERLMNGLKDLFPDENLRYKHIMEKQIFMAEFQKESAMNIEKIFNPDRTINLNLYVGDSLVMPEDFFDLTFAKRIKKYPQHYVWGVIPKGLRPIQGRPFVQPLF